MSKLKPCIVFDIDDTLVYTPDIDWETLKGNWEEKIMKAEPIIPNLFLYHAIDYLISDPPEWAEMESDWPQDIYFCTARPEAVREPTVHNLCKLTYQSQSHINKRLIMRPCNSDTDLSHPHIRTARESKAFTYRKLKERGYRAVLAFDNNFSVVNEYIDQKVDVIHQIFASLKDKEEAGKRLY